MKKKKKKRKVGKLENQLEIHNDSNFELYVPLLKDRKIEKIKKNLRMSDIFYEIFFRQSFEETVRPVNYSNDRLHKF